MKPQLLNVKTQHRQQNTYPTTAITARPPLTPLTPSCSLILQSEVDNIDCRLAAKEVSDKIRHRTRSAIERVLLRVAEEHTPAGSATHPLSSLSFLGRAPVSLAARLPPGATLLSRPRACLACLAPASRCAPPRLPLPGAGETSSFSPTACISNIQCSTEYDRYEKEKSARAVCMYARAVCMYVFMYVCM